jgi:hypothetical protein
MAEMAATEVVGAVVDEAPTALYRFYDAGPRLLYVGITDSPAVRWGQHAVTAPWWADVAIKTIEWYPTRQEALDAEDAAIAAENPIHNKRRPLVEQMTTRSWYMPGDSAAQLEALIDDLRLSGGLSKRAIMAACVNVAATHRDEVEAEAREAAGQHE